MTNNIHKPTKSTYSIFEQQGNILFQIDTYGTNERAMPEKVSQSIQIDKEMAERLIGILRQTFNLN